jgi:hypothetical protein
VARRKPLSGGSAAQPEQHAARAVCARLARSGAAAGFVGYSSRAYDNSLAVPKVIYNYPHMSEPI